MRITVSHSKSKDQIVQAVDRSFDDLFKGTPLVPIQITNEKRQWHGTKMVFSFDARMGLLSAPIKGTVEVTERDLTIDADLGLLEKLLGTGVGRAAVEGRVKGLLT
jgi:hypothetical protein